MSPRRAILCLAVGQTLVWAGTYYLFPALLLRWEAAEGWSKTTLTGGFTAALILTALFSPVAGRLIDRGLGPVAMGAAALVASVAIACLPLAPDLTVFVGLWLIVGVCMSACLYEPCFAIITRTRGADARRAITLVTLVAGFASTISFPLSHAVAEIRDWQAAAVLFGALTAFVAAPLLFFGANSLERRHRSDEAERRAAPDFQEAAARPVREVLRGPTFILLALAFTFLSINHAVLINHLLPIMDDRGIPEATAILVASLMGPMQVAGRIVMMLIERRASNHAITSYCFGALVISAVCLFTASWWPLLVFGFVFLQGSGIGISSIMKPVAIRELLGQANFGAISGTMALMTMAGFAFSPFLGSLLWEAGGYDLAILVVTAMALIGLVGYWTATRTASSP
ncbi:MAG: MFS transporter [Minwuia sp.]|uniref:MFS transporter n=1 Tax=Minwuia sp. TaxID=2493630 RepID=UPI003A84F13B